MLLSTNYWADSRAACRLKPSWLPLKALHRGHRQPKLSKQSAACAWHYFVLTTLEFMIRDTFESCADADATQSRSGSAKCDEHSNVNIYICLTESIMSISRWGMHRRPQGRLGSTDTAVQHDSQLDTCLFAHALNHSAWSQVYIQRDEPIRAGRPSM